MKKKSIAVAALASCMALSATFTGCSLVSSNNKADMAQEIATVNITRAEGFNNSSLYEYREAISKDMPVIKRDLVTYFINIGYSYVQNGNSYADTFNMLLDALVNNAVLVQYSTMALLEHKASVESKTASAVISEYKALDSEVKKYEYLLDDDEINLAKYTLYSSFNTAIDNYESKIIKEEEDKYTGTATRTTPTNLNTEQDGYYPKKADGTLDYNIYTGYEGNLLDQCGAYKDDALEKTTTATRRKAYNKYLNNLRANNLISTSEADKLRKVNELNYIEDEYVSQLESRIINKYYNVYEKEQEQRLLADNYIDNIYNQLLKNQTTGYKTASAFESALGNMSSTSFLLYSPDTSESEFEGTIESYSEVEHGRFGLVYNILLPFDAKQSVKLNELKSQLSEDGDNNSYYIERNKLLKEIKTVDQRSAWFNGKENYSFKASEKNITDYYGESGYLFFEGNLLDSGENGRYKKLQAYHGRYSYNGDVYENEDGSYTLLGEELSIDGMVEEFKAYINYVLTGDKNGSLVSYTPVNNYYEETDFVKADDPDEIDYSKLLYGYGKVDLGGFNKNDLFNSKAQTNQYLAMSAVNELQFAYTTDTGVLSQYAGYTVSANQTSYIKEFEYAAKLAVTGGEGSFTICAGDYGWHLIYVTYVFDGGTVYQPDWSKNIHVEGTFENLFFEWIKGNDLSDISTSRRSKIISEFNKEDVTVIKYQSRYQDLLDLENNNSNNTTNNNNQ